ELEAKLAKSQEAEKGLQQQMEASGAKEKGQLEAELAENKQVQTQLRQEIEDSHKHLQAQQMNYLTEQPGLETRMEPLQSAQGDLEQKVKRLTETLAEQTRRREEAEQSSRAGRKGVLNAAREFVEDRIRLLITKRREGTQQAGEIGTG